MNTPPDPLVPHAADRTLTQARRPLEGLRAGDIILGRYRVIRRLGSGGEAEVWLCDYLPGGIRVALKTIPDPLRSSPGEMDRIRESFRLAHELHHPNIAAVKFLEEDAQARRIYLVLEFVEGENARELMRRRGGRIPLAEALALARQVAEGLDFAHARGIVHRDIKPQNLMISPDGRVKILDFGIAAAIREGMSRVSNLALLAQGTPRFMSPEQWDGRPQDGRTDQYALAMTLVMMAAGAAPFDGITDIHALREAHLHQEPSRPEAIPAQAWGPIAGAMRKTAGERHGSCVKFVDEAITATRPGLPAKPRRRWRRAMLRALVPVGAALIAVKMWPPREESSPSLRPPVQVLLTVNRSSAGVDLSWSSEAGRLYSVEMRDRSVPNARWEYLPHATDLTGTGGPMKVRDQPPPGVNRNYRLLLFQVPEANSTDPKALQPHSEEAPESGLVSDKSASQPEIAAGPSPLRSIGSSQDKSTDANEESQGNENISAEGAVLLEDADATHSIARRIHEIAEPPSYSDGGLHARPPSHDAARPGDELSVAVPAPANPAARVPMPQQTAATIRSTAFVRVDEISFQDKDLLELAGSMRELLKITIAANTKARVVEDTRMPEAPGTAGGGLVPEIYSIGLRLVSLEEDKFLSSGEYTLGSLKGHTPGLAKKFARMEVKLKYLITVSDLNSGEIVIRRQGVAASRTARESQAMTSDLGLPDALETSSVVKAAKLAIADVVESVDKIVKGRP